MLQSRYPGMVVGGQNHPPTRLAVLTSGLVTVAQAGTGAAIFLGDAILNALHVRAPHWYATTFRENKVQAGAMAWIVGSTVQQNLLATGAFEVSYDGVLVFSKTISGRLPSLPEILAGVESVKQFRAQEEQKRLGEHVQPPELTPTAVAESVRAGGDL